MEYASCNITMYGKCREAVSFYGSCFPVEGKTILTFGDVAKRLNFGNYVQGKENLIYQAKLLFACTTGKFLLMMGDSPSVLFNGDSPGSCKDNITINIGCSTKEELLDIYRRLSEGGKNNIKPRLTNEHIFEGSLIDQFGVCWILRTEDCG